MPRAARDGGGSMAPGREATLLLAAPPLEHVERSWPPVVRRADRDEVPVGAFGNVIPGHHQLLELREGQADLSGHGGLLGFLSDNLGGQLPEIAQHRYRELEHFDLSFELRAQALEGDRVLRVELSEADYLHGGRGIVQHPPQIGWECLVCLLVEAELGYRTRLVPAWIVVVARGRVQAELHVVVGPDPLAGINHPAFQGGEDVSGRGEHRSAAGLCHHLPTEARNAHPEALVIADRTDLPAEPAGHLRRDRGPWARHEIESGVGLLPELEPVTLVVPGEHALGVHAEGHGRKPIERGLLCYPVVRRAHERLDGALGGSFEAGEPRHDLTTREYLDLEPAATGPLDDPRQ